MRTHSSLRTHLAESLRWNSAHATFDDVITGIPSELYGATPERMPYSLWQLLEHMRLTQHDILDFSTNPRYRQPTWPDDYWPDEPAPPDARSWADAVVSFRNDLKAMISLIENEEIDLLKPIPHGEGQTILREALLLADHNSYHLGQMVTVRRLLGIWE